MLTVPPPVKPRSLQKTNQRPLKMYTLHENYNNILALRAERDKDKTTTLAFTRHDDVLKMGTILENHYRTYKEWPDLVIDNSIKIYSANALDELSILHMVEWSFEELTTLCAGHYMDILQIDSLVETRSGFSIRGNRMMLEGTPEFYIGVCNRMLRIKLDGSISLED